MNAVLPIPGKTIRRLIRGAAISFLFASACTVALSRPQQPPQQVKNQTVTSGAQLYKRYCATCHGNDGKGTAPPPGSHFGAPTPDLTTLAKRHDGKFPDAYVADALRNGVKLRDHGLSEMPVWGKIFSAERGADPAQTNLRIKNLTNYLKSVQGK